MKRIVLIIEFLSDIVSGRFTSWLVMIAMCIVLVEVLTRYILQSPLIIADEVGAYILVVMIFMGLAYTWKEGGHIRIRFFVERLPIKIRKQIRLATLIMAIVIMPVLVYGGYDIIEYSYSHDVRSSTWMRAPLVWPQLFLLIGSVLLFLQMIVGLLNVVREFRARRAEPDEP